MIENGRAAIIAAIKQKNPEWTDGEVFLELVRVLYKRDLPEAQLQGFCDFVRATRPEDFKKGV